MVFDMARHLTNHKHVNYLPWISTRVTKILCMIFLMYVQTIGLLSTSSRSWIHHLFWWARIFKRDKWQISSFERATKKPCNVGFFLDTIKASSFTLCIIITLLEVYIVFLGLMPLFLFQGHRCVRNINGKLPVLDSCPL